MDDRPPPFSARAWLGRLVLLLCLIGLLDVFGVVRIPHGVAELGFAAATLALCAFSWRQSSWSRRVALIAFPLPLVAIGVLILLNLTQRSLVSSLLILACGISMLLFRPSRAAA